MLTITIVGNIIAFWILAAREPSTSANNRLALVMLGIANLFQTIALNWSQP